MLLILVSACGTSPGATASRTFDPCEMTAIDSPDASAQQLASIADGVGLWEQLGVRAFVRAQTPAIEVVFRDAASSIYGFYDDADAIVYVNTKVTDDQARAITIAHELGHALGLVHVPASERASVMNPGNLTVAPTSGDLDELARLWGACTPQ